MKTIICPTCKGCGDEVSNGWLEVCRQCHGECEIEVHEVQSAYMTGDDLYATEDE